MGEENRRVGRIREEELTKDGTVDLKGRPFVRSTGGRWKACSFIVGYEIIERMAYYGISSNLVSYLTRRFHQGTVASSNSVTNWVGTVWLTPILGAYVADAHLGRYWTFLIASAIYLLGMILLTLTVSLPSLRPPACHSSAASSCDSHATSFQIGIFYVALYIIAIGTGGTKPNISTMGADQFDDFEPKERAQKLSFFNWWMFSIFFGTLFANTFIVYIEDSVGWGIGYGIPTIGLAISIAVFLTGTRFYRHKVSSGSPYTKIIQVFVAAMRKWKVQVPKDGNELHELDLEYYSKNNIFRIDHTPYLRLLDKAAVKSGPSTPWMLCTVTQVEQTKQMIKMLPVLLVTLIPSVVPAQVQTLFIKQATTLDRSIGPHFKIPPASLMAFLTVFMLIGIVIYDRVFVPAIRKYTKNPRGITILQRMGTGLVMQVIIMMIAFLAERKRLDVIRREGIVDGKTIVPLSVFVLLPQFALLGIADAFSEIPKIEFFYDQAPEGMKSVGASYSTTGVGIGNFLSSFILSTVSDYTKRGGRQGWIQNNLNTSHIDYYYAFFATLSLLNLVLFFGVSKYYVYNSDVIETEIALRKARETYQSEAGLEIELVEEKGNK